MTDAGSAGQGGFLEQVLRDLMQMLSGGGPAGGDRIELARTFAGNVATGGEAEANVEPTERIRLEELARVAELHVAELTGLPLSSTGSAPAIAAVGPGAWAGQTVDDWRFLLAEMTASTPPGITAGAEGVDLSSLGLPEGLFGGGEGGEGGEELIAGLMSTMAPLLAAMQFGSAVGHLARNTLGQYELPIPRPDASRLFVVPANVTRFAEDWSLAVDDVRLWVCVRELTMHAVLTRPHVAARLRELLLQAVQAAAQDAGGLFERLGGIDPTDMSALERLMHEPDALLAIEPSPERLRGAADLAAVTAATLGYVEHVLDGVGARLLGGRGALAEAWRRQRSQGDSSGPATAALFGLDVGPAQVERGAAFVRGVIERGGPEGLTPLWESARGLPTPSEVDAPGLWLERLKLDELHELDEPRAEPGVEPGSKPGAGPDGETGAETSAEDDNHGDRDNAG